MALVGLFGPSLESVRFQRKLHSRRMFAPSWRFEVVLHVSKSKKVFTCGACRNARERARLRTR